MLDTLWVVIAATLVFLMQPGFMCLESGLTRSKNSINVAVKNLADFIFSLLLFWLVGYGLMFGNSWAGLLGLSDSMVAFEQQTISPTFFYFQAMFCGTATTIFSGAVAERMKFSSYLIMVMLLSAFIYPIFGHWAWNGVNTGKPLGWLAQNGFVDFAGSTVVHSIGGWFSLATLIVIGPRLHRFDGAYATFGFNGSNLPLSVLGTFLLWIGWVGFNGGSTLAMDGNVAKIIVHTMLAGAAGALAHLLIGYWITRMPRVTFLINGSLGGLVAITACCHCVTSGSAIVIGLLAGVICFASEMLLFSLKIDDAVGAIPVHLACGIWGTIAVALFGDPVLLGTGLSMSAQLAVQLKGIISAGLLSFGIALPLISTINRIHPLRVSAVDEHNGLNFSEHGATTELVELCQAMDRQAQAHDLSLRMPVEPFTEVGLIASRHNQVMEALEAALSHTEAVVSLAKDAIITFMEGSFDVINVNPSGKLMFGLNNTVSLSGLRLADLFASSEPIADNQPLWRGETVETIGRKQCGSKFLMQAVLTRAGKKDNTFYIGTFRDVTVLREQERFLKESEVRYRELFENIGVATVMIDDDTTIMKINQEGTQLIGLTREQIEGRMLFAECLPENEKERLTAYHRERRNNNTLVPDGYESCIIGSDEKLRPVYVRVSMIPGSTKSIATVVDLTELRTTQGSLERQRAYYHQLFEASSQAIVALDSNNRIVRVNRGFEQLFGYLEQELSGHAPSEFMIPADRVEEIEHISNAVLKGDLIKKETVRLHKDGRAIPVDLLAFPVHVKNQVEGVFCIYEDITVRKAFEEQLYRQAFYDSLTQIANRALFAERTERTIERGKRRRQKFAVMLIDLDRFKWVNDSLGHQAGDELLRGVSRRFLACVRAGDTVARLGGDEFAILIEDYDKPARVIEIANRLQQAAKEPFVVANTEVRVSASIGIVINTGCYKSTQDILRDADIAMYRAKELGKARFQVFNRRMHTHALETLQLENDLRDAITAGSFCLHYQPIVSFSSRTLIGFEALVRWNHDEKGLIYPDKFIPIAEEIGLIIPLGHWVMDRACRQMEQWQRTIPGASQLQVNINISPKQFLQKDLVSLVISCLETTGFDPQCLKIEITESAIMEGGRNTIEQMNRLKEAGIRLAIDDFGTGYSSLSAIQRFPLDDLKIDRSFIKEMNTRNEDQEIVKTIISLARTLGLKLVAEGVETEEQYTLLRAMGCDAAQGYLFSAPLSPEEVPAMIESWQNVTEN